MIQTRTELEREILSLKDRLNVAVEAVRNAKACLDMTLSTDQRKRPEVVRLMALVKAVSDESALAAPLLVRLGWHQGMKDALEFAREVKVRKDADDEWRAACADLEERISSKLNAVAAGKLNG